MAGDFLGIDLAWVPTNRTGLAVVDDSGRLTASGCARSDDEIVAWVGEHATDIAVAAVDAPLVVPNEVGQREGERAVARAFGRYGASPYPSNRSNPIFDPPRALGLAQRFGWSVDPARRSGVCIEVYPHPALVGLFALPQRLAYKKGPTRAAAFSELLGHLESVPELRLRDSSRWAEVRRIVEAPGRGDLTRIEDEVDAVVCAHLAWLWHHRPGALVVYGSLEDGYIVAPPAPGHAPGSWRPLSRCLPR